MTHPFDNLTPDRVVSCAEAIGLRCDLRLLALNSYENRVYQVGLDDADPIIVKFYRPGRWTHGQIQEEHAFTHELASSGLSVVAPMEISGKTLHDADGFLIAAFPRRGGHAPELDNFDHLLGLGRTLGRLHGVGQAKQFTSRIHYSLERWLIEPIDYLAQHWVPQELRRAWDSLGKDLIDRARGLMSDYEPDDGIRLHGDCHVGNILWRDDTPHFVDLDDCVTGPAIQDLWMFLSGDRHQREQQLSELIAGYEDFNDFDTREIKWIEALRTARMVYYSAWLARRCDDPAFPAAFPWFGQARYWSDQILALREQLALMEEPPLRLL
jgi:Ser/Thr protein kinase RdoA (MazF antagonist)